MPNEETPNQERKMSKNIDPNGEQKLSSLKHKMLKLQQTLIDLFFQERSDMKSLMKMLIIDSDTSDEPDLILLALIRKMNHFYLQPHPPD